MAEIFHEEGYTYLNPAHLKAISEATFFTPPDYHYRIKVAFLNLHKVCLNHFSSNLEANQGMSVEEVEKHRELKETKRAFAVMESILPCITPEYLMDWYDYVYDRSIKNVNIEYVQHGFKSIYDSLDQELNSVFSQLLARSAKQEIDKYITSEIGAGEQRLDLNIGQINYILEYVDKVMQLVSNDYDDVWLHSFYKNSLGSYYDTCTSAALLKLQSQNPQKFGVLPRVSHFINQELYRAGQSMSLVCLKSQTICNSVFLGSEGELGKVLACEVNDYFQQHSQPVFFDVEDSFYQRYLVKIYMSQSSRELQLAA